MRTIKGLIAKLIRGIILICVFFLHISCDQRAHITVSVNDLYGTQIQLPLEQMLCWKYDNTFDSYLKGTPCKKMIVYADSTECSMCFLRHLSTWYDMVKLEKNVNIRFVFIVESSKGDADFLYRNMQITQLNHPIYIDSLNAFRHANPSFPIESMFHTLLLDEENKVILVGDPTRNERINNLFCQIIDKK